MMRSAIQLLRAKDWAKNAFLFAPPLFAGRLLDPAAVWSVVVAAAALCALASSIYILNDLVDAPQDREHPVKRLRPIASGAVSTSGAMGLAVGLLAAGFVLLLWAQAAVSVLLLASTFLLLNLAYSFYLKRKVIVDVLAIAVGFVLRVLIGGAAAAVPVSSWLILCTFLLATFLGFSKRRHELIVLGADARRHRPVAGLYTEEFLDRMSLLTIAMAMTCYVLYTIAPETVERFGTEALVYSSLIVVFAFFRYLFLIHVRKLGSPTEILYTDRQIVLAVIGWVLYVVAVVYTWPALREGVWR
jgi:4-hydroxybenzoate polyprenyltransferase